MFPVSSISSENTGLNSTLFRNGRLVLEMLIYYRKIDLRILFMNLEAF